MKLIIALVALAALSGCASQLDHDVGLFVRGDIANAEVIAAASHNDALAGCLQALEPAAMETSTPANDGAFVLAARAEVVQGAARGPACSTVLAPILLRIMGKAAGPFGIALPF